ncbi:DUF4928 domain-containing protein [Cryobacterium levicorallinum]|uniref:DUF4928 domain-containing protein n=1 Tax=Cryobacterium levicorallinum TaxID=995038 RepID=A0A1I2ZKH1_9MICO|nr:DUF4928 family protein [Cryobacterium levicorallinum]TFB89532.1 DUF4928 domain-containing protein [Cryobacterium levicorallinum]SFH38318.1 protein of unknown function [Cryobacterium levicorallinum]
MLESPAEVVLAQVLPALNWWLESKRLPSTGIIHTNVMTVGLILAKQMQIDFPLRNEDCVTKSQVRGLSGAAISKLLIQFGESRPFTSEGGRTSRGSRELALELVHILNENVSAAGFGGLVEAEKERVALSIQESFVKRIQVDYLDRKRIVAEIDPRLPASAAISAVLEAAILRGGNSAGAVAQHLVGAQLALRFPDALIGNDGYTTADQQTSRPGDFRVGDAAIHVTMSPSERLMSSRCRANLSNGFRPLVIVPETRVVAARQLAENAAIGERVQVISIESFVGMNIEEMALFRADEVKSGLKVLLETYNDRVRNVEPDPSLQIEIPANL